jgi:molecular chaperone GrpE (heat shock protein)
MLSALAADGVTPIGEVGEVFDPTFHEAISQAESDEYEAVMSLTLYKKAISLEISSAACFSTRSSLIV